MFLTLVLASLLGSDVCEKMIKIDLAQDTAHTVYQIHAYDVPKFDREHPLGPKDYAPLHLDAGNGTLCMDFGSLRPFQGEMGFTGIAVSVGGDNTIVKASTDYNEFLVTGLREGEKIRIEFIQPLAMSLESCRREVVKGHRAWTNTKTLVPATFYNCQAHLVSWRVIEERLYPVEASASTK